MLYSCSGLDVNVKGKGYGSMLLLRGFARTLQEAHKHGIYPRWACVYATIVNDMDIEAIAPLEAMLHKFGFMDEGSVDIWDDDRYAGLTSLIKEHPHAKELESMYWFADLEELVPVYNERFGGALGAVKTPSERKAAAIKEELNIRDTLRNLTDTRQLSQGIVEIMLSVTFNRKLVLAFDSDIASCSSGAPLGLVAMLEKLKEDPRYEKILKNLVLIKAPSSELAARLEGYTDKKDTEVFVFALENAREELRPVEPKVRPVYINEKDFPMSSYYPLAEIVAISLAQLFQEIIPDKELITSLGYGAGKIDLEDINIESVARDSNALIFKLLPDAEPCDTGDLLKRYAKIKRFLKAA